MRYSFIVPVYNRPDEVDELLQSLTKQTCGDFEVLVVEDGSSVPCKYVVEKYRTLLDVHYFNKPNSGPGQTRNFGAERSKGEYLLILDSDCVLPPGYLAAVDEELRLRPADAFGGPDCAHSSFSPIQKAINYAMTSFLTTGGIRGGKKKMDKFFPRSFNMGVRADVYKSLGGFSDMRFGEDIDFSIRVLKGGYVSRLFSKAWVWHKRRSNFRKFFKQVYNSGIARINLYKKYPDSLKIVHLLPAVFTIGVVFLLLVFFSGLILLGITLLQDIIPGDGKIQIAMALMCIGLLPLLLFSLLIFVDASVQNKSVKIGILSTIASFIQLVGYGTGFLVACWKRCVWNKGSFSAFEKNFYS